MSDSPEQLEREVEAKRGDVQSTLDALRSKLSFGQIVDELGGHFSGDQAKVMAGNLGRQVRDNPLALGLIGAGLAWLAAGDGLTARARQMRGGDDDDYDDEFYSGSSLSGAVRSGPYIGAERGVPMDDPYTPRTSSTDTWDRDSSDSPSVTSRIGSSASSATHSVTSGVSGAASSVASGVGDAASAVRGAASSAGDAVAGALSSGRETMRQGGQRARGVARSSRRRASQFGDSATDQFFETLQNQPLVLGALAVAVGAAIGAALPVTRKESELLGPYRDRLLDDAKDAIDKAGHDAVDVATKAYEAGRDKADAEGLTPSGSHGTDTLAAKTDAVIRTAAETAREEASKKV